MWQAAIVVAALALPGCAALVDADWQDHPAYTPLPARHLIVADADIEAACGPHPGQYVYGCAVRLASENVCLIYSRADPADWIMEHERRHCEGWDHGPVKRLAEARAAVR
jgi:hypothetical protein